MTQSMTGAESKALTLLGNGHANHVVAQATGLSDSRISQLLSEDWFKGAVNELKYKALLKHNELDEIYDTTESELAEKLKKQVGMMFRPMEILKAISTINALKRRGVSSPESISTQQPALSLVLPVVVVQQFVKSLNNQVVEVDSQPLVTIQPGQLQRLQQNGTQPRIAQAPPPDGIAEVAETLGGTQSENSSLARVKERLRSLRERQNASLQHSVENPA